MRQDNTALWRSYARTLKARNRSEKTLASYHRAVTELDHFLDADLSTATKADVETYLAKRLTEIAATTVGIRFRSLRAFFNWCVAEEIVEKSPMLGLQEPAAPDDPPPVLDDDQLRVLLKTCTGKTFIERRDEGIIRLFCEPGSARLAEMAGLTVESLDMGRDLVTLHGKGNKTRVIPFGAKTGTALDRYFRLRAKHRHASSSGLWLGVKGRLTDSGIAQMITRRSRQAGTGHIFPHRLRHTSAHAWMDNGGSEGDAMALFGWSSSPGLLCPSDRGRAHCRVRLWRCARPRLSGPSEWRTALSGIGAMATERERSTAGKIAAYTRWAHEPNRRAATAPARRGLEARFEREVDSEGLLDPAERARQMEAFRRAYYKRLAAASAKARKSRSRS
jgi:site-specific recombinase XerD